jgi:hypothetical protein
MPNLLAAHRRSTMTTHPDAPPPPRTNEPEDGTLVAHLMPDGEIDTTRPVYIRNDQAAAEEGGYGDQHWHPIGVDGYPETWAEVGNDKRGLLVQLDVARNADVPPPTNTAGHDNPAPVDLDEVWRLCEAATPRPWRTKPVSVGVQPDGHPRFWALTVADATFIGAARELMPRMAAELAQLRAEVRELREAGQPGRWELPPEPGLDVTAVWDRDGDLWLHRGQGCWVTGADREGAPWAEAMRYAPLVAVPDTPADPPRDRTHYQGDDCTGGHLGLVKVRPTQYTVSLLPPDHIDEDLFAITVEYRGHGQWAIARRGMCLDVGGEWEFEPRPSERDDDWLLTHRFESATAVKLAQEAAPHVWANGRRALDAAIDATRRPASATTPEETPNA